MAYLHPAIAMLNFFLALYVMYMGAQRFLAVHLQKNTSFPWKKHVQYGSIVLAVWLLVFLFGTIIIDMVSDLNESEAHGFWGAVMLPLIIFGYVSGRMMDREKKKRQWLPLAHGLSNTLLICIAIGQISSGLDLIQMIK